MNRTRATFLLLSMLGLASLALIGQAGGAALAGQAHGGGKSQAAGARFTVWAGPPPLKAPPAGVPQTADANLFFPNRLQVHVGDSVTFKSGDFHTATYLGSHKTSEFPIFTPAADGSTYSGINDAAGNPFYFNGQKKFQYNPQLLAPVGTKVIRGGGAVQSSGALTKKGYTFTFSKPGDYVIHCLIHPMMAMHVVVKLRSARIQSASQLARSVAAEVSAAVATAKKLDQTVPSDPTSVFAGVGKSVPGGSIELMTFKPQKLQVKVGTTVTFKIQSPMEIHNMVFGPLNYLQHSFQTLDLLPRGPGQPNQVWPFFLYGSDPFQSGYSYDGTSHGNGFLATPLLGPAGSPLPQEFKITFTKPGVFTYICGIHGPDMHGEIDVVA